MNCKFLIDIITSLEGIRLPFATHIYNLIQQSGWDKSKCIRQIVGGCKRITDICFDWVVGVDISVVGLYIEYRG